MPSSRATPGKGKVKKVSKLPTELEEKDMSYKQAVCALGWLMAIIGFAGFILFFVAWVYKLGM